MVNAFVVMVVWIYQVVFSQHITVWMQCTSVLVLWEFSYPCYHCVLYIRCVACLHDGIWNFSLCIACHCRLEEEFGKVTAWAATSCSHAAFPATSSSSGCTDCSYCWWWRRRRWDTPAVDHPHTHSFTHSLTHSLTHSHTHLLTHSLTPSHSPTHSLMYHTLPAAAVVQAPAIDPFDLIDPIDMLSKMPKDFYERIVSKPIITIL